MAIKAENRFITEVTVNSETSKLDQPIEVSFMFDLYRGSWEASSHVFAVTARGLTVDEAFANIKIALEKRISDIVNDYERVKGLLRNSHVG